MCTTCIKLRKAAYAVIRTVLPKPKDGEDKPVEASETQQR